jgi:hypothetical protein
VRGVETGFGGFLLHGFGGCFESDVDAKEVARERVHFQASGRPSDGQVMSVEREK